MDLGLFEIEDMPQNSALLFEKAVETSRRNISVMREEMKSFEDGTTVTVIVEDNRYGVNIITGTPYYSVASGQEQMMIGGISVGKNRSDSKKSKEWEPTSLLKKIVDPVVLVGESSSEVKHGDLVSAGFSSPVYGDFTVAGAATRGENDGFTLLNKWILHDEAGTGGKYCVRMSLIQSDYFTLPLRAAFELNV